MRSSNDKKKFLEVLSEIPIVSVVCQRTGISKATVYRWRNKDLKFDQSFEEALDISRDGVNDLAEGQVIKKIKQGDMYASKFWLENNNDRYIKPRERQQPRVQRSITEFHIDVISKDRKKREHERTTTDTGYRPEQKTVTREKWEEDVEVEE